MVRFEVSGFLRLDDDFEVESGTAVDFREDFAWQLPHLHAVVLESGRMEDVLHVGWWGGADFFGLGEREMELESCLC